MGRRFATALSLRTPIPRADPIITLLNSFGPTAMILSKPQHGLLDYGRWIVIDQLFTLGAVLI